jgi:hypothetical protein
VVLNVVNALVRRIAISSRNPRFNTNKASQKVESQTLYYEDLLCLITSLPTLSLMSAERSKTRSRVVVSPLGLALLSDYRYRTSERARSSSPRVALEVADAVNFEHPIATYLLPRYLPAPSTSLYTVQCYQILTRTH